MAWKDIPEDKRPLALPCIPSKQKPGTLFEPLALKRFRVLCYLLTQDRSAAPPAAWPYCSSPVPSRHKTEVIPVDIPRRWEPRTNQSNGLRLLIFPQPLSRALKNQNAAPTTPPCFCRRQRSSSLHWGFDCLRCARHVLFSSCTAHHKTEVIPVDIPSRWEPRAKQQPTGLIAYSADWRRQSRPVRALYRPPKQKDPTRMSRVVLVEHCPQHSNPTLPHG